MTEREVFLAAIRQSDPAGTVAFLERVCGADHELRASVESLLSEHAGLGDFLEAPAANGSLSAGVREGPGTVVGSYKLLEQIGEGGFGIVFMADQLRPVRRKVAVKILKPGMDTRQVVARFEAERQALALMDHPNIAHVLDGGETESGRPYFVMELVRGVAITEYCDDNHLPVRERLDLFISICRAVQHAHQKGVIHRDLKPTNILVTLHDDTAVAKVIDFGIAKAMGQQLTEKTLFTCFVQMVGTPLYMSPEQAQMSGLDVDTRSDIYSLGVLLYELLTGTTPFEKERLRTAAYDEIRRIIREEEPVRPSRRVSTLGKTLTAVSAHRKTDPNGLRQLCRGELDWIVMKALEKNRNRRYETASALAADVERYLRDEPVLACPPSTAYRLKKFVRRNRGSAIAATFIVLALISGIAGTTLGMVRARAAGQEAHLARDRAERDRDVAVEARKEAFAALIDLTEFTDQRLMIDNRVPSPEEREFLQRMVARYERLAKLLPDATDAQDMRTQSLSQAGQAYMQLGDFDRGLDAWRQATNVHRRLLATDSGDPPVAPSELRANARRCRAVALAAEKLRRWPAAVEFANRQLVFARAARAPNERPDRDLFHLLVTGNWTLTIGLTETGQFDEARAAWEEMLRLVAWFEPSGINEGACSHLSAIAKRLTAAGRPVDPAQILAPGLAERRAKLTDNPSETEARVDLRRAYRVIGLIYEKSRNFSDALGAFDKAVTLDNAPTDRADYWVGSERHLMFGALIGRAVCLDALGREADAEAAWTAMQRFMGNTAEQWIESRSMHLARNGQPERAVRMAEESCRRPGNLRRYNAACIYAVASADSGASANRREEFARRALALLDEANAAGYFSDPRKAANMKTDSDLDPIRDREEFKKLIAELEAAKH